MAIDQAIDRLNYNSEAAENGAADRLRQDKQEAKNVSGAAGMGSEHGNSAEITGENTRNRLWRRLKNRLSNTGKDGQPGVPAPVQKLASSAVMNELWASVIPSYGVTLAILNAFVLRDFLSGNKKSKIKVRGIDKAGVVAADIIILLAMIGLLAMIVVVILGPILKIIIYTQEVLTVAGQNTTLPTP